MAKGKERLDVLMVNMGLSESREKAKRTIMAGLVFVDQQRVDKPGTVVPIEAQIALKGEALPFVSRGGLKLEKALTAFAVSFSGQVVADIGASTGGFTDCSLQHGAVKVYAIDVGYGQLAWKLRADPRVICLERVNARYLEADSLPEKVDWVVSDVSFISIVKLFPAMLKVLKEEGQALILIKPQFEAGKEHVGKKGVVRDPKIHESVLQTVLTEAKRFGFKVNGLDFSPIRGPEGNIEYLAWLQERKIVGEDGLRKDEEHGMGDGLLKDEAARISQVVAQAQKGST